MGEYFRYPSIVKVDDYYYLSININHPLYGYTKIFKLDKNFIKLEENIVEKAQHFISHNFTIFRNKENSQMLGLGGLIRNQKPFYHSIHMRLTPIKMDALLADNLINKERSGIYLFNSKNYRNFDIKPVPVLKISSFPKNATLAPKGKKKYEQKAPEFDSNICCFFSTILNKYVLFFRANVFKGCRSVQFNTTNDFSSWDPVTRINLPGFRFGYDKVKADNLYMFKCTEFKKEKILFGLSIFTNDKIKPTQSYVKKMISYDAKNWIDLGKLIDVPMFKDKIHANIHVAEILFDENSNILDIFLHHACFKSNNCIKKYTFVLDKNNVIEQLKSLVCNIEDSTDIISFNYQPTPIYKDPEILHRAREIGQKFRKDNTKTRTDKNI